MAATSLTASSYDSWSVRDHLLLASAVQRNGDQNWFAVSRTLRSLSDSKRAPESFSQKNCALQYSRLLEESEAVRKKRDVTETSVDALVRRLRDERISQLRDKVTETRAAYRTLSEEVKQLRAGQLDNRLDEIMQNMMAEMDADDGVEQDRMRSWIAEPEPGPAETFPLKRRRLDLSERSLSGSGDASSTEVSGVATVPGSSVTVTVPPASTIPSASVSVPTITVSTAATASTGLAASPSSTSIVAPASCAAVVSPAIGTEKEATCASDSIAAPVIKQEVLQTSTEERKSTAVSQITFVRTSADESKSGSSSPSAATVTTKPNTQIIIKTVPVAKVAGGSESPKTATASPTVGISKPVTIARPMPALKTPLGLRATATTTVGATSPSSAGAKSPLQAVKNPAVTSPLRPSTVNLVTTPNPSKQLNLERSAAISETVEGSANSTVTVKQEVLDQTCSIGVAGAQDSDEGSSAKDVSQEGASGRENDVVSMEVDVEPSLPACVKPGGDAVYAADKTAETDCELKSSAEDNDGVTKNSEDAVGDIKDPSLIRPPVSEVTDSGSSKSLTSKRPEKLSFIRATPSENTTGALPVNSTAETKVETSVDDEAAVPPREASPCPAADSMTSPSGRPSLSLSESVPASPASSSVLSSGGDDTVVTDDRRELRVWRKSILLVWREIAGHKHASMFMRPITDERAADYSQIVRRPMDLQTLRRHVDTGAVSSTAEFQRDLMLMFSNALMFNSRRHEVHRYASEMQAECVQKLRLLRQTESGRGQQPPSQPPQRRETRDDLKRRRSGDDRCSQSTRKRR